MAAFQGRSDADEQPFAPGDQVYSAIAAFQGHDTPELQPFAPGDQVYAEDGDGWRLATVQGQAGNSITLDDGSECAIDELLRWNHADVEDVSSLCQINEPAVLKCLEARDYAFCGPNVIIARGHAHRKMAGFASNPHPEPHVYALAERAFVARSTPQCIIATGAAGAGRTGACRAVASYLTWRGGLSTESELYMDMKRTVVAVAALGHCRVGAHDRSCVATATHFTFDARDALIGARTDVFLLDAPRRRAEQCRARKLLSPASGGRAARAASSKKTSVRAPISASRASNVKCVAVATQERSCAPTRQWPSAATATAVRFMST